MRIIFNEPIIIADDEPTDSFASKQPCPHCGRLFRTRSGMDVHIGRKHKEQSE